jgi:hypothetical protein
MSAASTAMTPEERAAWRAERAEEERIRRERALAFAASHPLSPSDKALAKRTQKWLKEIVR